jgi:hypothetical protein
VLDDGSQMVPGDYFDLADEAGGSERLRDVFLRRYEAAARAEPEPLEPADDEWNAYLSGEYGVCLKRVTPEAIARKSALVLRIEELLGEAEPDSEWQSRLRAAVDELDELERPFAPAYDALRFGGPSSRDRLITAVRDAYPAVFRLAFGDRRSGAPLGGRVGARVA